MKIKLPSRKLDPINTVYHGDCLEIMPKLPEGIYDMILCDLPYGITANKWDSIIPFEPLWGNYKRLIKYGGVICLTCAQPFTCALGASNIEQLKYSWVWKKNVPTGHLNAKKMPLKSHEDILIFCETPTYYDPQGLIKFGDLVRRGGSGENYGEADTDNFQEFTNYPKSIIEFDTIRRGIHPTQKPVDLFEYLIKTYTSEGDLVLDNCAGSGTTGEACLNTGRNFTLIEKDKKYFDLIVDRLNRV